MRRFSAAMVVLAMPLVCPGAFNFVVSLSGTDPAGDIFLQSVTNPDEGVTVTDFSLVSSATVLANDPFTGASNSGAASADIGDNATTGVAVEDPSNADFVTNLGNLNLNNIIDTEDSGNFQVDLSFEDPINNLLVFERGINSQLRVQALDDANNPIGNELILGTGRYNWYDAGYSINTTEIENSQPVGLLGVDVENDFGIASGQITKVRFSSESAFNGPDWKFVGTDAPAIPEPRAVLPLALLALGLAWRYRR